MEESPERLTHTDSMEDDLMHRHHWMIDSPEQVFMLDGRRVLRHVCKRPGCPEPVRTRPSSSGVDYRFTDRFTYPVPKPVLPAWNGGFGDEGMR